MANVLILMSDEHTFRVASPYGHARVETPNMARLAAHGVVYDAAYCPSPLCAPSRSSFMAGLPVHRTHVYNNCTVRQLDWPTYGAALAGTGVHSVHIGKTDVYAGWERLGFSEVLLPGDRAAPGDTNFCRDPLAVRTDGPERANGYGARAGAFVHDVKVVDAAVGWLDSAAARSGRPWSLTVNVVAPHFPHYATPELWEKYAGDGDLPTHGPKAASANHPYARDLRRHFQTAAFSETHIRGLRQGYLAGVDFVDRQLGRLLDALERTGQREETVVVYTSDHGEMLGTFGMWWKCSMYEGSVRIPLIAAGPGFAVGARVDTPVTLLDLQASIFRATGTPRPADWWGAPLQDVRPGDGARVAFSEYHGHGTRSGSFMIRRGPWKLLYHMAAAHQLFNVVDDPDELDDRLAAEPEIAAELEGELRRRCSPEWENRRAHELEREQCELLSRLPA